MTHHRDHLIRENSRCRKKNSCIYGFPHPITPETWVDEQGHVHFKRTTEEDRWIVSHIPELIDELDCHIHVDIVFTVAVFMYLYKYLFKGPDHMYFRVQQDSDNTIDKVSDYVDGRYLSAPEAAWRILGFEITSKDPSVTCLPVHLPGENIPQFTQGTSDQGSTTSLLIRYFHRPNLPQFENISYLDYFQLYVLYRWEGDPLDEDEYLEEPIHDSTQNKVRSRRQGQKVTRLRTISPSAGELFYLRCLLMHHPARSFQLLRTIEGTLYHTYHEAALSMGLFNDINEGYFALEEAVANHQLPTQLRFLFARIILEGYPALPLWNHFRSDLAFDYISQSSSEHIGTDRALQQIASYLEDGRHSLKDFGLPEPHHRSAEIITELEAFSDRESELEHQARQMYNTMNSEQKNIFCDILHHARNSRAHVHNNTFIEGKPGRGKTFLVDALCSQLRSEGNIVLIVGTSALAAALYERGRTAHSLFRIPVIEVCTNSINILPSFQELL
jgi:hypothetical protein